MRSVKITHEITRHTQTTLIACWRYVCRCYGAGLAPYTDKEIQSVTSTLYGRWFIALDMSSRRPNIDSKEFAGWIWDACTEERARLGR
jgi:hypothetical protein